MKAKTILSVCAAAASVVIVGCEQPAHPPPMSGTATLRHQSAAAPTRITINEQPATPAGATYNPQTGETIRSGTGAGGGVVGAVDPNAPGAAAGVGTARVSGGPNGAGQGGAGNVGNGGQNPNGTTGGTSVGGGTIIDDDDGGVAGGAGGTGNTGNQTTPPPPGRNPAVGGTGTGAAAGPGGTDRGSSPGVGGTGTGSSNPPNNGGGTGTGGTGTGGS